MDGLLDGLRSPQQQQVFFRNQAPLEQMPLDKAQPLRPVGATGLLEQDDRLHIALARLHQREQLERLVQRPETARKKREGVGLLEERYLAREEVLEVDQLGVALDEEVRLGLHWQPYRCTEAAL